MVWDAGLTLALESGSFPSWHTWMPILFCSCFWASPAWAAPCSVMPGQLSCHNRLLRNSRPGPSTCAAAHSGPSHDGFCAQPLPRPSYTSLLAQIVPSATPFGHPVPPQDPPPSLEVRFGYVLDEAEAGSQHDTDAATPAYSCQSQAVPTA
jgi:hypothetical protein